MDRRSQIRADRTTWECNSGYLRANIVSGELRPLLPEAPGHEGVDIARWPSGGDAFEGLR